MEHEQQQWILFAFIVCIHTNFRFFRFFGFSIEFAFFFLSLLLLLFSIEKFPTLCATIIYFSKWIFHCTFLLCLLLLRVFFLHFCESAFCERANTFAWWKWKLIRVTQYSIENTHFFLRSMRMRNENITECTASKCHQQRMRKMRANYFSHFSASFIIILLWCVRRFINWIIEEKKKLLENISNILCVQLIFRFLEKSPRQIFIWIFLTHFFFLNHKIENEKYVEMENHFIRIKSNKKI